LRRFFVCLGVVILCGGAAAAVYSGPNASTPIVGDVTTLTGSAPPAKGGRVDGPAASALFDTPAGIAVDSSGNLYVADSGNQRIRKITPLGEVTTLAGTGEEGHANGPSSSASFQFPVGVAVDSEGNLYVADYFNQRIRKISLSGEVTTLAGSGKEGHADGRGSAASFSRPSGVAVDSSGNVYVADSMNELIRKITPAGEVTTLAGSGKDGRADGRGRAASFYYPQEIAVDSDGNLYVADTGNSLIRKITSAGVVTTLAGRGYRGTADGQGSAASFYDPQAVAVDPSGNVYVADADNLIRRVSPDGVVTTIAGSGVKGHADGTATAASFSRPTGIAVDASGILYVADTDSNTIRKITLVALASRGTTVAPVQTTPSTEVVYAAGVGLDNGARTAVSGYWKNGEWTSLPSLDATKTTFVVSLAVSGNDVFAAGNSTDSSRTAVGGYWKNGVWTALSRLDPTRGSVVHAFVLSGNDVFAAGSSINLGSGIGVPGYWKNGVWTGLPPLDTKRPADVESLVVSGSDVYAAGWSLNAASVRVPGYWKNGVWTGLPAPDAAKNYFVQSLVVSGNDVYAAGNSFQMAVPGYWKNGAWIGLPMLDSSKYSQIFSLAVSGDDVYAAGSSTNNPGVRVPGYWKNGLWMGLPPLDPMKASAVYSIVVSGNDVYAAGFSVNSLNAKVPGYWKNGIWTGLPTPDATKYYDVRSLVVQQ
jgi:sugar lactone lactonase YvrE